MSLMVYRMRAVPIAFAAGVALTAVLALVVALVILRPNGESTTLRYTPSVVVAIKDLSRLESVEFHVERVIDLRDQQSLLFGLLKTEDAILFVATGEVVAGVDLAELADSDVVVDQTNKSVRITLPAARVLSTRLDNEHSWVFSRTTTILAQRHEDLETRARREAERTLEQSAIDGGILARARENAERTVSAFVRSLGYSTVTVTSHTTTPP